MKPATVVTIDLSAAAVTPKTLHKGMKVLNPKQ
jgi:hypothetical protein